MKFDIISVGSAVIDNFVYTNVHQIHREICYPLGAKIRVEKIFFGTGGAGTNTSVSFSRLGLKSGFLGKVGNDRNGELILKELKKEKVDFLGKKDKEGTGYSIILDSKERERTVLTYKGASEHLKLSDFKIEELKTDWIYFSSMAEESFETQKKIAKYAKKKGIKLVFNPSSYQAKMGAKHLRDILKNTEIIILNKEEARMLTKEKDVFKGLRKLGPEIICITDGQNGNKVCDGSFIYNAYAHKEIKCVERTGAGDAFASGFVAGLIRKNDIEFAIQIGSANAESVIKYMGAKNKLLTWNEALKIIKSNPVKIEKEEWKK